MSRKPTYKEWILATRPWSFATSVLPSIVAVCYVFCFRHNYATGINWWFGVWAAIGTLLVHAGGNLMSDYFDFKCDVDREDRMCNSILMMDGIFTTRQFLFYAIGCLSAGSLIGIYLFLQSGWPLLAIGVAGILGAVFYSRFKYRAMGDVVVFIIYGPLIMLGTAYVLTGVLIPQVLYFSFPIALLSVNILHSNNTRDIENDGRAGIRTLAMNLGVRCSVWMYDTFIILAYVLVISFTVIKLLPPLSLIVLLSAPLAWRNIKIMGRAETEGKEAIRALDGLTAQLQLAFCTTLSLALLISGWLL